MKVNSNQGDLSHITGGHINLNGLEQSAQSLNDLQELLNMRGRLVRFHYGLLWWAEDAAARSLMSSRVDWALQQGAIPLINPPSSTAGASGCTMCTS